MSIKNVVIVGAGGNLGVPILDAFLNKSSFNVSVLSRESSKSTFPSGAKVINADYDSTESLTTALKGQDAVISLIASVAVTDQSKLIDAAAAAGVKRFIPSEFGSDTANPRTLEVAPFLEGKSGTIAYLRKNEDVVSWTSVITGPFFDWGLDVGFIGFHLKNKKVTLYDHGKAKFCTTLRNTIGLSLIKILEQPELTKNQYVYVNSFLTTQEEILAALEKVSGEKWTQEPNVDVKEHIKLGHEKLGKGDLSGIVPLLVGTNLGVEEGLGDFSSQGLWNQKLGLPKDDFEQAVRAAYESAQ